jgi:EAL domain-containing protein (putative c-di-GMP-specific phosphodiesterase class I)
VTPHNRILVLVGGAAIVASLAIAVIFTSTNAGDADLQHDRVAARNLEILADQLLAEVHDQHEALGSFLLSADARPLERYRQAIAAEEATAGRIGIDVGVLTGAGPSVAQALAAVDTENVAWRARFAEPAIAAVQSGSADALDVAIRASIDDSAASDTATIMLVRRVGDLSAELANRADSLDQLRLLATSAGLVTELVAAGLSLWFVRRYGLTVSRDGRRRVKASAERIEIVSSLRALRTQSHPEGTATIIAEALRRLPGVDVAGVLECLDDGGLRALSVVGLDGFPVRSSDELPVAHARYLRERSQGGPWAERWIRPAEPTAYDERLAALGVKSRAFAPIESDGEVIALIAIITTDEAHGRHLVEDLPAVGEFASVAEQILAPALVARRDRAVKRRSFEAIIAAGAFRPVFQPVVDLATGAIVGFEALTRFDDGSRPDHNFAAASGCGMGLELESVTIAAAIRKSHDLPPAAWLSLNISPALLAHARRLADALAGTSRSIVLEVTEHEAIASYAPLREAMIGLGPTVRLAVDDVGAGVANFNHLVELRANFIKIDAGLVRGVDADPGRRAVVVGLIHFAAEAGCAVIAEGIETEAERRTVADLGVTLGQGYLLARPAPAETWVVAGPAQSIAEPRVGVTARLGATVAPAARRRRPVRDAASAGRTVLRRQGSAAMTSATSASASAGTADDVTVKMISPFV